MKPRVGIPRALLYYNYYPMWKEFFERLGAEIVLSELTNKKILDDGVNCSVDDACLPIKLFHGHVIDLKDRVDFLFIPRLISVQRSEYICPKFCGLPDMVVSLVNDLPTVIDVTVNMRNNNSSLRKAVLDAGRYITGDVVRIYSAYKSSLQKLHEFQRKMEEGLTPLEAMHGGKPSSFKEGIKIGLIGHPYNIYDNYASMDIIRKIRGRGIGIITQDMIRESEIDRIAKTFPKAMFWSFGKKIMAASEYLIDEKKVEGIIYMVAFGCGLDALVGDLVERRVRKKGVPFCLITIDEHTGEAGIDTRVEAFLDMLEWRNASKCW
ncbi:MAG: Activator of (R)-2-hydroxyglutaryl-CoA dehydratase [Firmicutes bacterium]|nr:Activator of (R)-2-hydroxyglutaryl-CoA dehydratase [Bacillota bacterium]MDI6705287.1 acyl-CoA dehydratase activase-related protein [Bacillota bacterium]